MPSDNPEPQISYAPITDPEKFEVRYSEASQSIMICFPTEDGEQIKALVFSDGAAEKLLTAFNVLLKFLFDAGVIEREGDQPFSAFEQSNKKNETLH